MKNTAEEIYKFINAVVKCLQLNKNKYIRFTELCLPDIYYLNNLTHMAYTSLDLNYFIVFCVFITSMRKLNA